jgi:predicted N-formylglutamate amidohydrolase
LSPFTPHPVEIISGDYGGGLVLLCDHASAHVPDDLEDLGLAPEQFKRHIAYDIGAANVTRLMAQALNAPALLTNFSRLIIDPNRGRDDPTLVMRLSDGAIIPRNAKITEDEVHQRITRFYDPYDAAIDELLSKGIAAGTPPAVIAVHSFTPHWKNCPRPWPIGILWDDEDTRLSRPMIERLQAMGIAPVGENEPYKGGIRGDTLDRHATRRGLPNALIEFRQDLIGDEQGAQEWAGRLVEVLRSLLR